jgi:hypothetical protein
MVGRDGEMVLLAEKRCQVGGQGIDEFLPLGTVVVLKPIQIPLEAVMPGFTQAPGNAAVHHGVFAIMQADAGPLINQRLDARKILITPDELPPLRQGSGVI